METTGDIELMTVGQLKENLSELEDECMEWYVVCIAPDGTPCHITSLALDEDGDLCIALDDSEYDIGDCYTVDMLLDEFKTHKEETRVYLAGHGLYMKLDDVLLSDDENEEIGFDGVALHFLS